MKKIFSLIVMLFAFSCISQASIANVHLDTEKETKIETVPKPYADRDLYGYWVNVNNTPEVKTLKLMALFPNGVVKDSLRIQIGDEVIELEQDSKWKFDPKTSMLIQDITNITYKINGKIEPEDFGEIEPVKALVTIKKRGSDIFIGIVSDGETLDIYQKITAEMKDEIHKKAQGDPQ